MGGLQRQIQLTEGLRGHNVTCDNFFTSYDLGRQLLKRKITMLQKDDLVIFHNIIDVSSYNAFVIWREINPSWMPRKRNKRREFLEQLGKTLVTPFTERREHLSICSSCESWPEG
ncbi:hypothetical protein N1851_021723 [Merluccius polli]|uniref:PiggyBac transposable element-derived protein domain-containing protein n=1 Tax=Merluccius polli TaxID=89951 RepID=A0AA47MJL4_MERPO|nr:hypothetical protein N1851_021723 [Merluccius polli]